MQQISLNVKSREASKAARRNRSDGEIFGVIYGHGIDPTPVLGVAGIVRKTLKTAGTNHVIAVTIDDNQPVEALVKARDYEPVSNDLRHFDLYVVKKGEKVDVEIPVVLVGEAPAAKLGLVVNQFIEVIDIRTVPSKIPESIEVDVSGLAELGDHIMLSDITLDEAIEVDEELLEQAIVRIDEIEELVVEDENADVSPDDVTSEQGSEEEGEAADATDATAADTSGEKTEPEAKPD
jgi:large subunit ribosomal protein L25